MSDPLFPHGRNEPPRITTAEGATWTVALLAVAAYVAAFLVSQGASYDDATPLGWMAFTGSVAGLTVVPAIILTGVRHLVPALRSVPPGEREPTDRVDRSIDAQEAPGS